MWEKPVIEVNKIDPEQITTFASNQVGCDRITCCGGFGNSAAD